MGILAIIAFVMLALTQTANADTSYNMHDDEQRWSNDKDTQRCDEGYWKADGSWHAGMDGKSDYGYWDNGCWRDTSRDQYTDKDRRTDEDCWHSDDSWDHTHESWNSSDNNRHHSGKDGHDGQDGKDGNDGYSRNNSGKYHSSAFSSVTSFINTHSDVRVSLR